MKKSLISIGIGMCIFLGSSVLAFKNPIFPWTEFSTGLQRIYNPIHKIYEQKSEEEVEQEWIEHVDYYSDESVRKFLDDNHPLSTNYEAQDTRKIISDFITNKSSSFYLRNEAAEAFELMAWSFSNAFDFKAKLTINSARRSQAYQRKLASSCSTARCAKPGTSEHEAGLALDLGVNGGNIRAGSGKYYQWLIDNAHLYGFHNSYQKGIGIDGKMVEPRHWRYVGVRLATILHDRGQTFAEFFYENIEKKN